MLVVHVGALQPKVSPVVAFMVVRLGVVRHSDPRMETFGMDATRKRRVKTENCVTRRALNVSEHPN